MPNSGGLALLAVGALFALLERRLPRRPGTRTDLAYWFFTPLVTLGLTPRLGQ